MDTSVSLPRQAQGEQAVARLSFSILLLHPFFSSAGVVLLHFSTSRAVFFYELDAQMSSKIIVQVSMVALSY